MQAQMSDQSRSQEVCTAHTFDEAELHHSISRASGLIVDAACACRAARTQPLPPAHRRHVARAIRGLEDAQDALFNACHDPWPESRPADREPEPLADSASV